MFSEQDRRFMQRALYLAREAQQEGEVPVGAIIVRDGSIIGEGWNRPILSHDATAHAEIQAIRVAGKYTGNYRIPDSRMYVTLEPCPMCAAAIVHARIDHVVYATPDPRSGAAGSVFDLLPADKRFNHRTTCEGGLEQEEASEMLKAFFRTKR
jgi:tRNA(adenine34) deaminase